MTAEIDNLLDITEKMVSLAIVGEWDKVALCEAERVAIIESLTSLGGDVKNEIATKLKDMIEKNAEIVTLALTEKDKIADELKHSRRLEKADQAYRNIDQE